jgi:hypothetical protein
MCFAAFGDSFPGQKYFAGNKQSVDAVRDSGA